MNIQCTVLKRMRNVAVVRYRDISGNFQATIIPVEDVQNARVGSSVEVSEHTISTGTEYGIDWAILIDTISITPEELQQVLRSHGIWTDEDFKTMVRERTAAVLSIVNKVSAVMLQTLREEL